MLVFLLTSPALTGFILGDWESAAFGVLGNALLLLGAYLTVGFGLLPILHWGARRLIRDATDVLGLFARALPLLLIFVTFLFITAEVWQMAGTLETLRLVALIGLFALVAVAFLISRLPVELSDLATFDRPKRVIELVQETPAAGLGVTTGSLRMDAPLRPAQWMNVGLVVLVALALRVLFVSTLVGVFFLVFGLIAMHPSTIATWTQSEPRVLLDLGWLGTALTAELLQVAVFMASFSGFYFTISVLTNYAYRDEFFEDVVGDVRHAFAVRAVYLGALAPLRGGRGTDAPSLPSGYRSPWLFVSLLTAGAPWQTAHTRIPEGATGMSASADLKERIAAVVESHRDDIVEVGETIMRNPELGFKEFETAALVQRKFDELELDYRAGLARTGVKAKHRHRAGRVPHWR